MYVGIQEVAHTRTYDHEMFDGAEISTSWPARSTVHAAPLQRVGDGLGWARECGVSLKGSNFYHLRMPYFVV